MSNPPNYCHDIEAMRAYFKSGITLEPEFRKKCLLNLKNCIVEYEEAILAALKSDLAKPPAEAWMTEVGLVLAGLGHLAKKVCAWSRPRFKWPDISIFPAFSFVQPEPFGVALILSPWNYPFQLSLLPLIAAIAAGNCAILKPSRHSPATGAILRDIIAAALHPQHCMVILDEPDKDDPEITSNTLLAEKFDFIFYTGSPRVGHIIMEAASKHLTPVCLELGGKSPCIVAEDANLDVAAKRIAWGKFINAGQTCVAPDYLFAHNSIRAKIIAMIREEFGKMLGSGPLAQAAYGRMVSREAFDRISALAKDCGLELKTDAASLKIEPVVFAANMDCPALQDEIFGPLLPALGYDDIKTVIDYVQNNPKPLACYLFTTNRKLEELIIHSVPFGGGCINDVALQASSCNLPFGGVGRSGMGRYHGRAGFDLFSNPKGIVRQWSGFDLPLRYPPYGKKQLEWLKRLLH